jgi:uncharacterized RDD family membrane protein YckC
MADRAQPVEPLPARARAFQGLRAGVVSRCIAGGIDYLIVVSTTLGTWVGYVVLLFLVNPRDFMLPTWPFGVFVILGLALMTFYLTLSFATTGRTLGDRVMGLRVVGRKGTRMAWGTAALRGLFCAFFPVGLFWCAVSRQNRSVQDVVLRTSVIHAWPVAPQALTLLDVDERSEL